MKDLSKNVLHIVGVLFAGLLLGYTGFQTFSLLNEVSGSPLIAAVGLIMFEVGMIYWWMVFRNDAEGLPQMALSLLVFLACLTFVVMATALQLGAVGADVLGVNTPAKIITAAAVIQLAAKLFFPLLHPDVTHAIQDKVQEGRLIQNAEKRFEKRADGVADMIAAEMAEEWTRRLTTKLNSKYHIQYQLGEGSAPVVIEGQTVAPDEAPPAPKRSFMDRLRGRPAPASGAPHVDDAAIAAYLERNPAALDRHVSLARPADSVGNSTHPAPPSNAPHTGQGDAGNGAPPPVFGASPEDFR